MESKITYFEEVGQVNTEATLALVRERAAALGIGKVVLASTRGETAQRAVEVFRGLKLVVVAHQFDFHRTGNQFPPELVRTLREAGHEVYFGTMLFHTGDLYGSNTPTVMADLLRCFSQGVKVCFEIVLMATDGGLVTSGEKVIAVAGSGRGSDTALVMQAASSQHLKRLRVNEIICKPWGPLNIDESLARSKRTGGP